MSMTNFLKERKSTREFKNSKASSETIKKIEKELSKLKEVEDRQNFSFRLYENGENISKGFKDSGGYSGVMVESPHYISFKNDGTDRSKIAGAYYMEQLISKIHNLGLASCWVTVVDVDDEVKLKVLGEGQTGVDHLLAIGTPKRKDFFASEEPSVRKAIEEVVFLEEIGNPATNEELEDRGLLDLFYYIRYAPSEKNLQPWRFLIEGNKVTLIMEEDYINLTDAGIVMYYFEGLANFIGISSKWKILENDEVDNYKKLAEIQL